MSKKSNRRLKIRISNLALVFLASILLGLASNNASLYAEDYKTVTDMCGNRVEIPVRPKRIACMHCVSPEKIMTLGKGDSISLMAEQSPWAYMLYPEIKNSQSNKGVTPEQMANMSIDFVLYTPGMTKGEQYSAVDIRAICAFSADKRPMNFDQYIESFKNQVTFFGDVLGPDAKARADKYNEYFEKKVKQILSITSKIDRKNRPSVYYGGLRGSMLNSQGNGSAMHWNVEVSGGNYLPQSLDDNHAKATMEQILLWDPDIILLSGLLDSDIVTNNPSWANTRAVKNKKVYRIPMGVYAWDHASNEGVLLMIYMAKIFYPDLFRDWDMIKEMKTLYSEVYGKTVTNQDMQRILQHLPPL